MDITVSKAEIFKEVEKRSSLEGLLQEGRFEDLWASEEEGKFLETYWIEGCMAAVQVFKRYLTSTTVTHTLASYDGDETFSISAEMPERYNGLLTGSVETDVKMMIAAHVMYGWMNVLSPGQSKKYGDESASYAEDLKLNILYRDEPTGNFQESLADDEEIDTEGEKLGTKPADDEEIDRHGDGIMIHKGMDRLKLTQHHECDYYFRQRRDYGRCDECSPCDRQEAFRPRTRRQGF